MYFYLGVQIPAMLHSLVLKSSASSCHFSFSSCSVNQKDIGYTALLIHEG